MYIKADKTGISDAFIGCAYDSQCSGFVGGAIAEIPGAYNAVKTGAKTVYNEVRSGASKVVNWAKGALATSSSSSVSVNLLKTAAKNDDVIIGAFKNGKITKQFLMNTEQVYGHKTFLEGTEVGFTIYKDLFTETWVVKGSGTASEIGAKYITPSELEKVAKLFGIK